MPPATRAVFIRELANNVLVVGVVAAAAGGALRNR